MSIEQKTCVGCAHAQRRFKRSAPRTWCIKYHRITDLRCIDYKHKRTAIQQALDYLKRSSIK
jgi:hypothetical protein